MVGEFSPPITAEGRKLRAQRRFAGLYVMVLRAVAPLRAAAEPAQRRAAE